MRIVLSILLAAILLLSIAGCVHNPPVTTVTTENDVPSSATGTTTKPAVFDVDLSASWTAADIRFGGRAAFSDVGCYHLPGGKLSFMDTENGISVILCQKAGCDHADTTCEAYIPNPHMIFYSGGHIYYDKLVRSDPYSIHVFRRNADGTGEEEIAVLGQEYISQTVSLAIGEYLATDEALYFTVYSMEVQKQDDGSMLLLERDGILLRLDLKTKKQEEILRKRDTLIRLIGGRDDALLFYTLDKLPAEMNTDKDYSSKMQTKPASFQVWDRENDSFFVLREETYADFTDVVGLQGGRIYYKDYDGACFTYEVATDTVSKADYQSSITIANDRYIMNGEFDHFSKTYPQFVDCKTGQTVSSFYDDALVIIRNTSKTGCVIEITYEGEPIPNGHGAYTIPRLRQIVAYVAFDALEDGLQESDLLVISDEKFDT